MDAFFFSLLPLPCTFLPRMDLYLLLLDSTITTTFDRKNLGICNRRCFLLSPGREGGIRMVTCSGMVLCLFLCFCLQSQSFPSQPSFFHPSKLSTGKACGSVSETTLCTPHLHTAPAWVEMFVLLSSTIPHVVTVLSHFSLETHTHAACAVGPDWLDSHFPTALEEL